MEYSSCTRPSTVLSFRFIWLTFNPSLREEASTAKPWFCDVIYTFPFLRSFTGWFEPLWPYLSLYVLPPKAIPVIWWPRQMFIIGILPFNSLTTFTASFAWMGSPGPFDIKRPSGSNSSISVEVECEGTNVTFIFLCKRERSILSFIPQSMATTCRLPLTSYCFDFFTPTFGRRLISDMSACFFANSNA